MVAGLGSLLNSDNSMMLKLMNDVSSLEAYKKATETKENDGASVEDVFSQIIDQINKQTEKLTQEQANLTTASAIDNSNAQFGPPAGMEIDGLEDFSMEFDTNSNDTNSVADIINDIKNSTEIASSKIGETSADNNSDEESGGTGGAGGGEKDSDDEDNPMDLNKDGTVTLKEMLSYLGIKEYGNNQAQTGETVGSAIDEILDLII